MFQVAIKKDLLSPDRGNAAGVNIDVNTQQSELIAEK